jgi:hypothetical protein
MFFPIPQIGFHILKNLKKEDAFGVRSRPVSPENPNAAHPLKIEAQ